MSYFYEFNAISKMRDNCKFRQVKNLRVIIFFRLFISILLLYLKWIYYQKSKILSSQAVKSDKTLLKFFFQRVLLPVKNMNHVSLTLCLQYFNLASFKNSYFDKGALLTWLIIVIFSKDRRTISKDVRKGFKYNNYIFL